MGLAKDNSKKDSVTEESSQTQEVYLIKLVTSKSCEIYPTVHRKLIQRKAITAR